MVSSADRTIVARTAPRTIQNSLRTCRARSRGARARKGTALLSSTAKAPALCRPLSRSTRPSQRESTARPHHPDGQSVLDRQALADLIRAFAFELSTRSEATLGSGLAATILVGSGPLPSLPLFDRAAGSSPAPTADHRGRTRADPLQARRPAKPSP